MSKKTIAIIGAGPVGTSILCQINSIIKDKSNVKILIFEKTGELGPGLPYRTNNKHHIINLPANILSPFPDEPDHFVRWLNENKTSGACWKEKFPDFDVTKNAFPEGLSFPPRALYGLYLTNIAREAIKVGCAQGIEIEFIPQEVIDIEEQRTTDEYTTPCYQLTLNDDNTKTVDYVLLSVGHMESDTYVHLKGKKGYTHNPWEMGGSQFDPDKSICILGSRLTAIDTMFTLLENGHRGEIFLVSRQGLVPAVIGKTAPYFMKYLTRNAIETLSKERTTTVPLSKIKTLFEREMSDALGITERDQRFDVDKFLEYRHSNPIVFLQHELERIQDQNSGAQRHWQSFLYTLYLLLPHIWQVLNYEDKEIVEKKYYSPLMTFLAAFPAENAGKVRQLLEGEKIKVKSGCQSVDFNSDTYQFDVTFESDSTRSFNYVINGTGPGYTVKHSGNQLLINLVGKRILTVHPFGGVRVDFRTLQAKGKENFWVLGEATRGDELATTDLGTVSKHIERALLTLRQCIDSDLQKEQTKQSIREMRPRMQMVYSGALFGFEDRHLVLHPTIGVIPHEPESVQALLLTDIGIFGRNSNCQVYLVPVQIKDDNEVVSPQTRG